MTLVLRLIRQSRWDSPERFEWLGEGDIPADPLADFANTCENCLSVWFLDGKEDLNDIVAALAAAREKADKLDFMLFAEEHLRTAGIKVRATTGDTPDAAVNGRHRDLVQLSAAKVLALTTRVWRENLGCRRIDGRSVVQLVADAVRRGRVALQTLRPKLRDEVISSLGDRRDEPRKPR